LGSHKSGWETTTNLKRSEFGLTRNKMIEGAQIAGDNVEVDLRVEADKQ
jgi:polyisoprenoid-binding protein YceI